MVEASLRQPAAHAVLESACSTVEVHAGWTEHLCIPRHPFQPAHWQGTARPRGEGSANGSLATDVWDAGVIRLVLESWGGGNAGANADALPVPLGVCYVDPGGGYGTRQLRFSRWRAGWQCSS
eukprot:1148682-Pelagomonas_calceolata.AAC.9